MNEVVGADEDGNIFTRIFNSISKVLSALDPTSDTFFLKSLFEWFNPNSDCFIFNSLFSWLNPASDDFILKNILDWLNPFSENFILYKIINWLNPFSEDFILKDIIDVLNPWSDNFIGKQIVSLFSDLFNSLFIPSEERITSITDTVKSKFAFIDTINSGITTLQSSVENTTGAPTIELSLDSTKYTNSMNVNIIDMSWYAKFKSYGDVIITGFVYVMFLWRLYIRISAIINGSAGAVNDGITIYKEMNK